MLLAPINLCLSSVVTNMFSLRDDTVLEAEEKKQCSHRLHLDLLLIPSSFQFFFLVASPAHSRHTARNNNFHVHLTSTYEVSGRMLVFLVTTTRIFYSCNRMYHASPALRCSYSTRWTLQPRRRLEDTRYRANRVSPSSVLRIPGSR